MLGRITALLTPFTIGALSRSLGGLGNAVDAVSIGPVIGAAVLVALFWVPRPRLRRSRQAQAGERSAGDLQVAGRVRVQASIEGKTDLQVRS